MSNKNKYEQYILIAPVVENEKYQVHVLSCAGCHTLDRLHTQG